MNVRLNDFADPVPLCTSPKDAYPTLPPGQCARLIYRTRTRLVYALGDELAPHPFQHVTVGLPDDGAAPTVQWCVSTLVPGAPQVVLHGRRPLRAQHFFTGRRRPCEAKARALQDMLALLHRTHRGDALRAYQQGALVAPTTSLARGHALAFHVWKDVMREYTDRLRCVVRTGDAQELLRVARRMERLYPPPPSSAARRGTCRCAGAARWRWWRWRLARRLRFRYPLLTRRAARALASDITYVTRCPRAATWT